MRNKEVGWIKPKEALKVRAIILWVVMMIQILTEIAE